MLMPPAPAEPAAMVSTLHSPPVADAIADLRTVAGAARVSATWRYTEARIVPSVNRPQTPEGRPGTADADTFDLSPRLGSPEFDRAPWAEIAPGEVERRRTAGKLAMGWYRLDLTVPADLGGVGLSGASLVLNLTVDDYAEVSVNGELPQVLGSSGGPLISGWNTPTRVLIARDAHPGEHIAVAVLAVNGPLSAPPTNSVWVRSATLEAYTPGRGPFATPEPVPATIVRKDPEFDAVLPKDAVFERLASGFSFVEGPVWVPRAETAKYGGGGRGGYLLFSDPNQNIIHRWDPATGLVSVFRASSGYTGEGGAPLRDYHQPGSNGLTLDPEGRLTICEHGNRRVTRLEPNGSLTVLSDHDAGKRLNSPNDLVYRSDGALYFTDPPFGLPKVYDDPRRELGYAGVYLVRGGVTRLAAADVRGPNGLAFSPDERRLYVDNWDESAKIVLRYDVAEDGTLSNRAEFFNVRSFPEGRGEIALDGLKVDAAGRLLVSGPGGIWVISADGRHLGTFSPPEVPANFAWGDEDGRTLYMTARTGLYRVRLGTAGSGRPGVPR